MLAANATGGLPVDDPEPLELEQIEDELKEDLGLLEEMVRLVRFQMGLPPRRATTSRVIVVDSKSAIVLQVGKQRDRHAPLALLVQIRARLAVVQACVADVRQCVLDSRPWPSCLS